MSDAIVARVYRALLRSYPATFRAEYGDDMVRLLEDQLRDEAMPIVVARALADLAVTVPDQHLEAHMRTPTRLVPFAYLVIAAAAVATAVLSGSRPVVAVVAVAVAAAAGAVGLTSWRHARAVTETDPTAGWWKFLLAAPLLVLFVLGAAAIHVSAWYVGLGLVVGAAVSFVIGIVLAIAHLARVARAGATASI